MNFDVWCDFVHDLSIVSLRVANLDVIHPGTKLREIEKELSI
jgi:hypothetical protein